MARTGGLARARSGEVPRPFDVKVVAKEGPREEEEGSHALRSGNTQIKSKVIVHHGVKGVLERLEGKGAGGRGGGQGRRGHVLKGVRDDLGKGDPDHASSRKAGEEGEEGGEHLHKGVRRDCEQGLRDGRHDGPHRELPSLDALGRQDGRHREALGNVVQ